MKRVCLASLALAILFSGLAVAQQQTIDKPVTIYIAGTAGGGIDLYGRLLGRHLGKHIPGNPSVVVQVMPGAGGIRAANFLAEVAPKDGTAMTTFPGGPLLEPLIGARNPGYDSSKFSWVGAISRDVTVCMAWAASGFKTVDDVRKREMVLAGTGAGSETDTHPPVLNDALGTKFRVITGYLGSRETFLAIESGEVHGRCGMTYSALLATRPDWIRDHKVNFLLQIAREKSPELPDVPLVMDLLTNIEDKQLFELLTVGTVVSRPFALPPGTPESRVTILRRAFDATMEDSAFLADGKKMQADITPTTGEDVQSVIARAYATPKNVVERAKRLLTPAINK